MSQSVERYDDFLQIYNEVDHYMRKALKEDRFTEHNYLVDQMARKSPVVARYAQELRALAQLRNSLVHNPFMRIAHPMAVPDPKVIAQYRSIRDALLNPATAFSIAVPANKLFTATIDDLAVDIMTIMKKHTYTHVPIMEGDRMVGVFSENSLLAYVADNRDSIITKDLTLSEFKDYIGFNDHPSERYVFLPRRASLGQVHAVFQQAVLVRQRVGVVFLTETGKPTEKVLGIITAWDLAQPEFKD